MSTAQQDGGPERDGRAEPIYFDKIISKIEKLCYGLEAGYIDRWLGIHGENIEATIEIFGLLSQKLSPTQPCILEWMKFDLGYISPYFINQYLESELSGVSAITSGVSLTMTPPASSWSPSSLP